MQMTALQALGIIAAMAIGTQLTRWLPFWMFPESREPPTIVEYLGKVLPSATMGLLVVYCLKDVTWFSGDHGLPQIIAIVTVAILHRWKSNTLLSIAGGTAMYMFLLQVVFA